MSNNYKRIAYLLSLYIQFGGRPSLLCTSVLYFFMKKSLICMCTDPLIYHVDNNTGVYIAVIVVLFIALALSITTIVVLIYIMSRKTMNKPRKEGIHFHFQFILRES